MNIGYNIKKLRRERDMTQEQLAEYLNISVSAISQWESEKTAPDISMLAPLANIFDVSSDTLLGIDINVKKERIEKIQKEAWNCLIASRYEEAEKILRAGIKEYPNGYTLMGTLMCALCNIARLPESETKRKAFNEEIIALGEKILAECTDDNTRHWAIQQLCYAYCDMDEHEKARLLVDKLSGRGATREYLLGHTLKGTEKFKHIQREIALDISSICTEILQLNSYSLDSGIAAYNSDENAALNHKVIDTINIFCEDGNFGSFSWQLNNAHFYLCEFYLNKNDYAAVKEHLKLAAKHAILFDAINRIEDGAEAEFTSLLFRGLKSGISKNIAPFSRSQYLLERIVSGNYSLHFPSAEINAIKEDLQKYANPIPAAELVTNVQ
jgi:transcriptional regulator with XRE-family HTH domain